MPIIRPATAQDLTPMHLVYYANEMQGVENPPPPSSTLFGLRHIWQTGNMFVAEENGQIIAFAGAITRGLVTFLTDLFVLPGMQSAGLGKALLARTLPEDQFIHCTMTSTDPRAQALYIRAGMRPQFPNFNLLWHSPSHKGVQVSDVEMIEGDAGDPAFVHWDAHVSGRERVVDHAFWVERQQGVPFWFKRQGVTIGYGYVRLGAGTLWYPDACTVGPIGVRAPDDAIACTLAAVRWAQQRASVIRIDIPGPHPALASLLESGFQIIYVEIFVSTATTPFFDPCCYISSGSNLL